MQLNANEMKNENKQQVALSMGLMLALNTTKRAVPQFSHQGQ